MAERERDPALQELYDNKEKVYSISKLNSIDQCKRQSYYSYIEKVSGQDSIYGVLGTGIHDSLEKIYNGEATEDILYDELIQNISLADSLELKFPKDFKGNDTIRANWIKDMSHFCKHYKKLNGEFTTEELFILKGDGLNKDRYLIGYIDLIEHLGDNKINIYDFKTSSNFKKEDLLHHGRQLIAYAIAKEQEGYEVGKIAWIMLKYVEVEFEGYVRKNSKTKKKIVKVVNRNKIVKELYKHLENELYALGKYSEIDIDIMLSTALENNSLDGLPDEVKNKFIFRNYIREYPYTEDLINEFKEYFNTQATAFESLPNNVNGKSSWKPIDINDKNSFYCNNLCNFRKICPAILEYNDKLDLGGTIDIDSYF